MEKLMICRECGDPTNDPPFEEWKGYCPDCVVKVFVFPLIPDENLRNLIELKMSVPIGIAVLDLDGSVDIIEKLKVLFKEKAIRDSVRKILDHLDKKEAEVQKVRVDQPLVRNDPRTG